MIESRSFNQVVKQIHSDFPDSMWLTVISEGKSTNYTYDDLYKRVNDYLSFYESSSLVSGQIVTIILKESLDLFASFLGATIYGLRPAYLAYPSPKQSEDNFLSGVAHIHKSNSVGIVVTYPEAAHILRDLSELKNCLIQSFDKVAQTENMLLANLPANEESFLQFSSGTTGAKKGVEIFSGAFFNQVAAYLPYLEYTQDSKVVSWLPHYHDMGLIACMLMPLVERVPIIMMSPFEWISRPAMLLEIIDSMKPTHLWLPNFALGHLTRVIDNPESYDLSSIKSLTFCSEPLLKKTYDEFTEKFFNAGLNKKAFRNCYAMAENTFAMTTTDFGDIKFRNPKNSAPGSVYSGMAVASAGKPLPNTTVKLIVGDREVDVDNEVGEIWIKSDCMLNAYNNNEEETRNSFSEEYFNTGDLGCWNNKELYIAGRKKDLIIIAGENVYPYDIELALNKADGAIAGRNVVFGVMDEVNGTEKLVALVETREQTGRDTVKRIKNQVFEKTNWVIHDLHVLPHMTLIKGTAGKVSRYLNKQAYLDGKFSAFKSPADKPATLEDVLEDLINGYGVNRELQNAKFFTEGLLDSLSFATLVLKLEKLYECSIPDEYLKYEYFDTTEKIQNTIKSVKSGSLSDVVDRQRERLSSLDQLLALQSVATGRSTFWEFVINRCPFNSNVLFRFLFKCLGIQIGKNVNFLGKPKIKIRGKPGNISIGDEVILGDGVDIRNREDGKIILHDRVYCDANVRLVAAREGRIELGKGTEIGANSVINSGGNFITGKYCLIASNVNVNTSTHGISRSEFIKIQPHSHGNILLGDDVWVGSGASILLNSTIGEGAIVSANSLVSGYFPPFSISLGNPAKVIKFRD